MDMVISEEDRLPYVNKKWLLPVSPLVLPQEHAITVRQLLPFSWRL